ncbi:MAG: sugar ABC transporter permease, partial [Bacillota bacterium]|nr:sugar ABC transporter permease [Bacillota bacterium]
TAPVLIMTFAYNFNNFNIIYLLTDGNPVNANFKYAGSTDILITWVFKMTNDQGQYHMASVVAIILFIFIAGLSMYSLKKTKSFEEEDMM